MDVVSRYLTTLSDGWGGEGDGLRQSSFTSRTDSPRVVDTQFHTISIANIISAISTNTAIANMCVNLQAIIPVTRQLSGTSSAIAAAPPNISVNPLIIVNGAE